MADLTGVFSNIAAAYNSFVGTLPSPFQNFISLFLLVILIIIYAVFVWKLHRYVGTKNIFELNLNQYNTSERPFVSKMIAIAFYLLEYIVILPFIIFFWFSIFTLFLILLIEEDAAVSTILLISAIAIASIRMASYLPYYGEALARELSKIMPFTVLAIAVLTPSFFVRDFVGRILSRLSEIPLFFSEVLNYLVFIIALEVILRFFDFLFNLMGFEDTVKVKQEEIAKKEQVVQN